MGFPAGTTVLLAGRSQWLGDVEEAIVDRSGAVERVSLDALAERPVEAVDLVFVAHGDRDPATVVEHVRSLDADCPVLVGDEADSAALETYYTVGSIEVLSDVERLDAAAVAARLEARVRDYRERRTAVSTAKRFESFFADGEGCMWVLDDRGVVQDQNECDGSVVEMGDVRGESFFDVDRWVDAEVATTVAALVEDATPGQPSGDRISLSVDGDDRHLDVSVYAVPSADGEAVGSYVVEAEDVTEFVTLETELRRSEELHRVVLNNMTDTIFITDETGAFTYVCPNVHFIFGYSAEEIQEMGTVDRLLGEDLFDRERLTEAGTLRNVETTATDKSGTEHTLLVTVREVDIQGGTILYSCRDITERKRREESLAALQQSTRDLLLAETESEIAHRVVEEGGAVVDVPVRVLYLFDDTANALRPVAYTPQTEDLHGPVSAIDVSDESIPSQVFVDGEPRIYDDVHEAPTLTNAATELRGAAYIPLGEHGVFVAGSPEPDRFDEVRRELVDLLAATAEAAIDRVKRETALREKDRALQRRNADLERLNQLNEIIRAVDRAVVRAGTREDVESAVCSTLTRDSPFRFAWIGRPHRDGSRLVPAAWSGSGNGYLDAVTLSVGAEHPEVSVRAHRSNDVVVAGNLAERMHEIPWRRRAISRDFQSAIAVPLSYDEVSYGVLTVYSTEPDAFGDRATDVLAELGQTIAAAISATERKAALLAPSNTRLEYDVADEADPIIGLARAADCTVRIQGNVQQSEEGVFVYASVIDGSTGALADAAESMVSIADTRVLDPGTDEGLVRLNLAESFVAQPLANHGAVLRELETDGESTTLVVTVPDTADVSQVSALVATQFESVEFRSKQTIDEPATTDFYARFVEKLTDRQLEVIQAAYYGGYFESPRRANGEEIAEVLGISPPAFYRHVRTVQAKLFPTIFDEFGVTADGRRRG
ncbi:MAG: bacterio-opsin activator domain-containing protein [Halanaeroarchaeum sp.]